MGFVSYSTAARFLVLDALRLQVIVAESNTVKQKNSLEMSHLLSHHVRGLEDKLNILQQRVQAVVAKLASLQPQAE
jgi:hypothetical protein